MQTPTLQNRTLIATCVLALALAFAPGCSDDDTAGDNNNNVIPDAGADAAPDAGPQGETVTIRVIDTDQTQDGSPVPMEGATVAVDLPGGERVELTTDADGRVTVEGIDWSLGTMNLQGYFAQKMLLTLMAHDATSVARSIDMSDEGDLEIWLSDLEPAVVPTTYVDVTGSATGFVDTAHSYFVHVARAQAEGSWDGDPSNDYALSIQTETEFTLVAGEYSYTSLNGGLGYQLDLHRVSHQEVDPLLDATTVDLDLAAYEVAMATVDASVTRDYRPESPLNALMLQVYNFANDTNYAIGWASYSNVSVAGDYFDVSHHWSEPLGLDAPFTQFRLVQGNFEVYSFMRINGYPQGGVLPRLVDIPEWISPTNPTMAHPLHSEITFESFDDVAVKQLLLHKNTGTQYVAVHAVGLPPEGSQTSFTIPEPPSTVNTAQLYGTGALAGQLLVGDTDANNEYFERLAVPEIILVAP